MITFPLIHSFEITVINKTKGGKEGSIHETTLEFIHFERTRSVSVLQKKKKSVSRKVSMFLISN